MKNENSIVDFKKKFNDNRRFILFVKNLLAQSGVEFPVLIDDDNLENNGIIKYVNKMSDTEELFSICITRLGNISGSNNLPEENITKNIVQRLRYLLNKDFIVKGNKTKVDRILLVCLGNISKNSRNEIKNKFSDAIIHFWDLHKIFEQTKKVWSDFLSENNPIINEYCKNLLAKLEDINKELSILYYNKKVKSLWDLFIDLQLQEITIKNKEQIIKVDITDNSQEKGFISDIQRLNLKDFKKNKYKIEDIIESNRDILITGDMGCGKSTILKRITQEFINKAFKDKNSKIPIFILARNICDNGDSIEIIITKEIKELTKGKEIDLFTYLNKGDIVLLIDGLEERIEDFNYDVIKYLRVFKEKYPQIQIIVTSRPIVVIEKESLFNNFRKFDVLPLDQKQVNELLEKWYPTNRTHKDKLLNILKRTTLVNSIPKTPLTLTLLAIIFEDDDVIDEIPANITELYNKFVDVFTGRWEKSKGVSMQDEFGIRTHLLRQIALELHWNMSIEIDEESLLSLIQKYLSDKGFEKAKPRNLLNELLKTVPLFVKSQNSYKFIHLSFQEYYTSFGIRQTNKYVKFPEKYLASEFLNPWWANVILFYVGDIKDCPDFLIKVSEVIPSDDIHEKDTLVSRSLEIDQYFLKVDNIAKVIQAAIATDVTSKTIALDSSLLAIDKLRSSLTNFISENESFHTYALKLGFSQISIIHIMKELFISLNKSKYTKPSMIFLFENPDTIKRSHLSSYILANCLTTLTNDAKYLLDFMANDNIDLELRYLSWSELNKKFIGKLNDEQKKIAKSVERKVKKGSAYLASKLKKLNTIPKLKEKLKRIDIK